MLDLKGFGTEELKEIIPKLKSMVTADGSVNEDLIIIFHESDKDENGYLDKSELKIVLEKFFTKLHITLTLTSEMVDEAFNEIDTNHDYKISAEEFGHFVTA